MSLREILKCGKFAKSLQVKGLSYCSLEECLTLQSFVKERLILLAIFAAM